MLDRSLVFAVLAVALLLFVNGRWRYDLVALLALVTLTISGIVGPEEAFAGFGHPAVITIAAVLVLSRGVQNAGIIDLLGGFLNRIPNSPSLQLLSLMALVSVCSAFINNVGAVALLMPVAMKMAERSERPASLYLMPLAFGSLLGGMTTLIGTPPNIIISSFRPGAESQAFGMFDFAPVGGAVALAGGLFIALFGWRLLPSRPTPSTGAQLAQIGEYLTELRVVADSEAIGKAIHEVEQLADPPVTIIGLERAGRRLGAPSRYMSLSEGDVILMEGDPDSFAGLVSRGLELVGGGPPVEESLRTDEVGLIEAVVGPGSTADGALAMNLFLRGRYGVNLIAVARQGASLRSRMAETRLRAGDVLLLQGPTESLNTVLAALGLYPLAERELRLGHPRRVTVGLVVLAGTVGLVAFGVLAAPVAFVAGAVAMVLVGLISLRQSYEAIDWPIIVLIGAMIPVGGALESTGGARLIADGLLAISGDLPPEVTLVLLLVGAMFLSDLINNAAAAVLLAPIAVSVAASLSVSADAFLMAVAIGATSAFLTPIGHQSNTLVLGPGGYRFSDYWRLGLPLELVVVIVAVPILLAVWG